MDVNQLAAEIAALRSEIELLKLGKGINQLGQGSVVEGDLTVLGTLDVKTNRYPDLVGINNIRLSASYSDAIPTGDVTAERRIYAHPYKGNRLCLYNNANERFETFIVNTVPVYVQLAQSFVNTTITSDGVITGLTDTSQMCVGMKARSQSGSGVIVGTPVIASIDSTTQVTLSTGGHTAGTMDFVDFWVAENRNVDIIGKFSANGIVYPALGSIWSSDTERAVPFVPYLEKPMLFINSGYYVYLGTVRTVAAPTNWLAETEQSLSKQFVWNYYNRMALPLSVGAANASWNYSTAAWRQVNAAAANRVECVIGVNEDPITARALAWTENSTTTFRVVATGVGIDSTTVNSAQLFGGIALSPNGAAHNAFFSGHIGVGYHAINWLERGAGTDTQTWRGSGSFSGRLQSGLLVELKG